MLAVQESRDIQIRADVLNDDVRRIAPAADRDVAVGECEPLERDTVRRLDDFEARAGGVRESSCIEAVDPRQIVPDLIRDATFSGLRSVGQLRPEGGSRTGIDPE